MKIEKNRNTLLKEFYDAPLDTLFSQKYPAAIRDCSEALLERERWAGTGIPYLKIGGKGGTVRYRKSDILSFIDRQIAFKSTSEKETNNAK